MHQNNALIKDGDIYLFDNCDYILVGDPLFDVATVIYNTPGGLYFDLPEWKNDPMLRNAFLSGYGIEYKEIQNKIDMLALLLGVSTSNRNNRNDVLKGILNSIDENAPK